MMPDHGVESASGKNQPAWAAARQRRAGEEHRMRTVLLEAAIAGLPVLTTEACGYAPYIREGALGQVLAEPSGDQLVHAARALLEPPRERWRERSRAFAARADIYDLVEHAVDAIEQTPRQERR